MDKFNFDAAYTGALADSFRKIKTAHGNYYVGVIAADFAMTEIGKVLNDFEIVMDAIYKQEESI